MSSPSPSANMEGAKDEEKSDVYSTNMTEAMGAGKLNNYVILYLKSIPSGVLPNDIFWFYIMLAL